MLFNPTNSSLIPITFLRWSPFFLCWWHGTKWGIKFGGPIGFGYQMGWGAKWGIQFGGFWHPNAQKMSFWKRDVSFLKIRGISTKSRQIGGDPSIPNSGCLPNHHPSISSQLFLIFNCKSIKNVAT